MPREDPATKGDLEDLAKSFKEGVAGLVGANKGSKKAPAPTPVETPDETETETETETSDESPFKLSSWWFGKS